MDELPIACTLTPAAMEDRAEWLRRLGADSLIEWELRPDGLALRFDAAAEGEVRKWVGAERECCAFLTFDVERNGRELRLRVGGPAGSEPVLDGLLAALRGD
jgi:hypothetical protein